MDLLIKFCDQSMKCGVFMDLLIKLVRLLPVFRWRTGRIAVKESVPKMKEYEEKLEIVCVPYGTTSRVCWN